MLRKLYDYYDQSLLFTDKPHFSFYSNYHWFTDEQRSIWLAIPFDAIHKQELSLLKNLFHYESLPFTHSPKVQKWYDFLYLNGELPTALQNLSYRIILFQLTGAEWERNDLEEAIYGFFNNDSIILWEDKEHGVIIDHDPDPKFNEKLILSLSQMLESDFFIKAYFYSGKLRVLAKDWPEQLKLDKFFFRNAIRLLPSQPFHTFEKCFPTILADELPNKWQEWLDSQLLSKISDEPELLAAVMRFLENNSNATLTAKQLYIHRNTLQYRLDKFTQKTGVNLKDFHSSITVYLACLLAELNG